MTSFYAFWVEYISEGLDGVNRLPGRGEGGGAKNWPFCVKKWNILTVSRKKVLTVKDF